MGKTMVRFSIDGASKVDISERGIMVWDEHDNWILSVSPHDNLKLTTDGATYTSFQGLMRVLAEVAHVVQYDLAESDLVPGR